MGGMACLEYPLNTPPGFVRAVIPLATSARHSAWCISWGEAQRQSIYSDPDYRDGYYYDLPDGTVDLANQPNRGLAAARMAALLTYRSRDSFESRFGRRSGLGVSEVPKMGVRIMGGPETTNPADPSEVELARSPRERAWRAHNDGHRSSSDMTASRRGSVPSTPVVEKSSNGLGAEGEMNGDGKVGVGGDRAPKVFSAQSYLRYQGNKVGRAHVF
jgi:homoserine O-acetyltransferase